MTKNKTSKRILFIVGAVLCCIFALMLVCNLTIIIKGVINPEMPPSVLGVTPMVVQSGSMTEILCEPVTLGQMQLADGKTVYQVIELIAEAVQAEPSNAAQEVWGVTVQNGVVTAAQ